MSARLDLNSTPCIRSTEPCLSIGQYWRNSTGHLEFWPHWNTCLALANYQLAFKLACFGKCVLCCSYEYIIIICCVNVMFISAVYQCCFCSAAIVANALWELLMYMLLLLFCWQTTGSRYPLVSWWIYQCLVLKEFHFNLSFGMLTIVPFGSHYFHVFCIVLKESRCKIASEKIGFFLEIVHNYCQQWYCNICLWNDIWVKHRLAPVV